MGVEVWFQILGCIGMVALICGVGSAIMGVLLFLIDEKYNIIDKLGDLKEKIKGKMKNDKKDNHDNE